MKYIDLIIRMALICFLAGICSFFICELSVSSDGRLTELYIMSMFASGLLALLLFIGLSPPKE